MNYATFRNLVAMSAGDPFETRIPAGLVHSAIQEAFDEASRVCRQVNPEAMKSYVDIPIQDDTTLFDFPRSAQDVTSVVLFNDGDPQQFCEPIGPDRMLAADANLVGYYWADLGDRRLRITRPDLQKRWVPGARLAIVTRFFVPIEPRQELALTDGVANFARYYAAHMLSDAPGARPVSGLKTRRDESREAMVRAFHFRSAHGAALGERAWLG